MLTGIRLDILVKTLKRVLKDYLSKRTMISKLASMVLLFSTNLISLHGENPLLAVMLAVKEYSRLCLNWSKVLR